MSDNVTHPTWYAQYAPEVRHVASQFGFYVGNVIKYVCRAGTKTSDPTEDLQKACQYIRFEAEWRAAVNTAGNPHSDAQTIAIHDIAHDLAEALGQFAQAPPLPGHARLEWLSTYLGAATSLDGLEDALLAWEATRGK